LTNDSMVLLKAYLADVAILREQLSKHFEINWFCEMMIEAGGLSQALVFLLAPSINRHEHRALAAIGNPNFPGDFE
jgi:hypothetical protein